MNTIFNFFIEANFALVILYGAYWLLLRNENQFGFKRIYLVGGLLASVLFPLITLTSSGKQLIPSLSQSVGTYWLPEITVYANDAQSISNMATTSVWQWVIYLYLAGAAIALFIFIFRITSLVTLFRVSNKYEWRNFIVAETEKSTNSFSFFNYLFIGKTNLLNHQEKLEVLNHEAVHAEKMHSLDILLINLMGIIFWFNPLLILYKNSLVQVHEFEADARAVEGRDVNTYCSLLARVALQANGYPIANHFTNSLTLKRITMMKAVRKKIKQWKVVTMVFTVTLLFFVVACQDQVMQDIQEITDNSSAATLLPANVEAELLKLKKANPKAEYLVMEMNEEGKKKLEELDKTENFTKSILSMSVIKSDDQSFVIIQKGEKTNQLAEMTATDGEVFTVVEETATPVGGFPVLYEYIAKNIKYPLEARTKGIQGKVFVEFIVNTDGKLSNFTTLKGIGSGCDEEAIRVLETSPISWTPGVQRGNFVKQRMVIPISFLLSADKPAAIAIGEVQPQNQEFSTTLSKTVENGVTYLTGVVKDTKGKPLTGTNIVIEGTTTGTVSATDGTFKLAAPTKTGKLIFSFVGYNTQSATF